MSELSPIIVIGAGSWGTSLAVLMGKNGYDVHLWGPETEVLTKMQETRRNEDYLPGIVIPDKVKLFTDFDQAVENCHEFLIVAPSHVFRDVLQNIKPHLQEDSGIAWATKGLDATKNQLLHETVYEIIGKQYSYAVISGPSFAMEVAENIPTAVTLVASSKQFANHLKQRLCNPHFILELSDDFIGVQLGGVVKNILAIATGIIDGLGYGSNTRAVLLTRGLAEMTELGLKMGADPKTFTGLAGLGDLVLTCGDNKSRNRRFGVLIGQGKEMDDGQKVVGQIVEGVYNAKQIISLANKYQSHLPIIQCVYEILFEDKSPKEIIHSLFK